MKPRAPRRPRNPVARAVRTPQYRMRVSGDKRRKVLDNLDRSGNLDRNGNLDRSDNLDKGGNLDRPGNIDRDEPSKASNRKEPEDS